MTSIGLTFFNGIILVLICHFSIKHYLLFQRPKHLSRYRSSRQVDSQDLHELHRWNKLDLNKSHLYEDDSPILDEEMVSPVDPVSNSIKKSLKDTLLEYAGSYDNQDNISCLPLGKMRSTRIKKTSFGEWDKFFQM